MPNNLLIIMSDEHSPKWLGCYGERLAETPNIDRLAAQGTLFTDAYTTCPVCVPARAGFATGRYIHQVGFWDNADPFDGSVPSWQSQLRDNGHHVVSIGKLHFRSPRDDNGFSDEILPMHVVDEKGDLLGLVRDELPVRGAAWKMAKLAGPGESSYTHYDRLICARAQIWLHEEAPRHRDKPWVLFVSFACPHFPLTAPPEFYYRYRRAALPMPKLYSPGDRPRHPFLDDYSRSFNYDDYFDEEKVRSAVAGYLGLCSFVDENVGKVLQALEQSGAAPDTTVVYTSDHGDNLGARGLWGKSTMYRESVGVPLIVAGQGIPAGERCNTPTSHVDLYPFIFETVGCPEPNDDNLPKAPGISVQRIASGEVPDRSVLSEYHGMGSRTAAFMIRNGRFKYIFYVGYPPQLFDLDRDPEELVDIAGLPGSGPILAECEAKLRAICDPDEVNQRAKARQSEILARHGGREAAITRGDLGFSPIPGEPADFQ